MPFGPQFLRGTADTRPGLRPPHLGGLWFFAPREWVPVTNEAEEKLAGLLRQVLRHQESAREFALAGYVTMAERHKRLLRLVCAEIRRHCMEAGLEIPDGLPPEELD
jgi:hypothetical protein